MIFFIVSNNKMTWVVFCIMWLFKWVSLLIYFNYNINGKYTDDELPIEWRGRSDDSVEDVVLCSTVNKCSCINKYLKNLIGITLENIHSVLFNHRLSVLPSIPNLHIVFIVMLTSNVINNMMYASQSKIRTPSTVGKYVIFF